MKKTIIAFLLTASLSQAALYTLTNGSSATSNGIGNSTGTPEVYGTPFNTTSAFLAVGYFNVADSSLATLSGTSLVAAFQNWGASGNFTATGAFGNKGTVSYAAPAKTVGTGAFAGQNMYVLVGNSAGIGTAATQYLVLKTTFQFLASDDSNPSPITKTFNAANSTLLVGANVSDVRTTTADSSATAGWRTVTPVPEPSAALLGAIGALGLLRRRRN